MTTARLTVGVREKLITIFLGEKESTPPRQQRCRRRFLPRLPAFFAQRCRVWHVPVSLIMSVMLVMFVMVNFHCTIAVRYVTLCR